MITLNLTFLPGLGTDQRLFSPQIDSFSRQYNVRVLLMTEFRNLEKMATKLAESQQKQIVIGHSLGGGVAQIFAALYPSLCERLVLINTWANQPKPEIVRRRKALIKILNDSAMTLSVNREHFNNIVAKRHTDSPLIDLLMEMRANIGKIAYLNQLIALQTTLALTQYHAHIHCPTLILHGEQDSVFDIDEATTMSNRISNAQLISIPDCGHIAPLEEPEIVTKQIQRFLT